MTGTELHPCEGCTKEAICKARSFDGFGRLVCGRCIEREKLRAESSESQSDTFAEAAIRQSFRASFQREYKHRGIDPRLAANKKVADAALKTLFSTIPTGKRGTVYFDTYQNKEMEIVGEVSNPSLNPSRRRLHPARATVAAAFPRAISEDGRYFAHVDGNVVTTSLPPQYAKFTSLPDYIGELVVFANK